MSDQEPSTPTRVHRIGDMTLDLRTERHEFSKQEWAQRQRREARRKRQDEKERARREWVGTAMRDRATRFLLRLGLDEKDVTALPGAVDDYSISMWLDGWRDHPERERIEALLFERYRASLELVTLSYRLPRGLKLRLEAALARSRRDEAPA